MHVILTGATGLVGSAVLDAMIKTKDITKISILSRRPVHMADDAKDPRINVILQSDFEKYDSEVLKQLQGAKGCVWALGISQSKVDADQYVKITKDYAIEAAKAFATLSTSEAEPFRFVYVSGSGATQEPGRFSPIFARIKGETETALADLTIEKPTLRVYSPRPAFVDAQNHKSILPYIPNPGALINGTMFLIGPPMRMLMKSMHSPTPMLGDFLAQLAMGKLDGRLEGTPGSRYFKGRKGDIPDAKLNGLLKGEERQGFGEPRSTGTGIRDEGEIADTDTTYRRLCRAPSDDKLVAGRYP
ncbi:hypothetical protein G7Z17_g10911 [Cylindrodendrum hubeiense]|uniref:NAD(P)-binding domain-containing protein n=1 Tax=Cylindrodendrum hubeiense TaxID=595255 RepID=A0A9P5H679_9HYPO|nr:hypothetical protein G7Z17_g10911 [Cylindrodendrum hubeiense]